MEQWTDAERQAREHQEDLQRLRNFRLMDDDFFTKCFDGENACVELALQIILGQPKLRVRKVRTQVFLENLLHRSVRLDVLAVDSRGRRMNVEIQRDDRGAGRKRARYNSSMMDAQLLSKGEKVSKLPETYVIFITERDVLGRKKPLYQVERCVLETGELFGDGTHLVYVNGACRDGTPLGRLMQDFFCTDPDQMYYPVLAERVRYFKESKEGVRQMCRAMEDMWRQSLEEGIAIGMERGIEQGIEKSSWETAQRMLRAGTYSEEEIIHISGLSREKVREMQQGKTV